jgi:hypothetical protein
MRTRPAQSVSAFNHLGRRDSGSPDHRSAGNPLAGDNDTVIVDMIGPMSQPHLHSQLLEPLLGPVDKSSVVGLRISDDPAVFGLSKEL